MKTLRTFTRLYIMTLLCGQSLIASGQYCAFTLPAANTEPITLVDFAGINNPTANTSSLAYEDFTAISATVLPGNSYTITVKGNTFGNYSDYIRVFIDWNQNNLFTDPGEYYDVGILVNSTGLDAVQVSTSIAVPVTAGFGNTRMRVTKKWSAYNATTGCNTSGYGQAEDYTLNIISANSCTGTPTAGLAAGPSTACPGVSFPLSLSGYTSQNGISFQWQEDIGSGWQAIAGATNPSYSPPSGITVPTSYRAVVTCVNGGGTDNSNVISVSVSPPTQCYCNISFPSGTEPITLVDFAGINNPTTAATTGTPSYEDFSATITGTVIQGQTAPITVKGYTGGAYTDSIMAFIDWNQNGLFSDPGEDYIVGALFNSTGLDAVQVTTNIAVPATATVGATRMRVTKKWNAYAFPCNSTSYGQAEDYAIDVLVSNSCQGMPTAGTATAPASICPNTAFNLNLNGYTLAAGINIQWESSPSGMNSWQNVIGATTASYTVATGINTAMDYRALVTCVNGGASALSNVIIITTNPFLSCYCATTNAGGIAITNITIQGTALNNTTAAAPGPNYYVAYPATGSTTATMMQGLNYPITATFGSSAISSVWIDFNQDGIFDASEWTQISTSGTTGSATISVPANAATGLTGMRVRSRGAGTQNGAGDACTPMGGGETEDYLVTIAQSNFCSSVPAPGTASGPASVCPNLGFTVSLTGTTAAVGVDVQWQRDQGSGWSNITGANALSYTETGGISVPTSYQAVVTCVNATGSATSNVVAVAINGVNQCYCQPNFPSGVEPITLVDFAGINNGTPNTSSAAYEDFSALSGSVAMGSSYGITVKGNTLGNYTDYIRAYIDWNQNGVFTDPGEQFDLGTITNSTGLDAISATGNITVPLTAAAGTARLRVLKLWNSYALSCNTGGYGQAEDYSLVVGFPLAIKLKEITAAAVGTSVRIDWSTATELASDNFVLERSSDAIEFTPIHSRAAKGAPSSYVHFDKQPLPGVNYYRLQLTDGKGGAAYSKTVSAMITDAGAFSVQVFPNPAKDMVRINVSGSMGANPIVSIFDATGKLIRQAGFNSRNSEVTVSDLAPGMYLLKYQDDNNRQSQRFRKL
jgi:hypothetical protein